MIDFQGHFTEWLDNSPILFNAWIRQSFIFPRYESSVYTISEDINFGKRTYTHINVTENQPKTNKDDNCTAIYIGMNLNNLTWLIIPCDKPFEATFVCTKPVAHDPIDFTLTLNPRNVSCDDGWIQMKDSSKCQILLTTPTETISFVETQHICSAVGGTVFAVNPLLRNDPPTEIGKQIVGHLQTSLLLKNIDTPPEYTNPEEVLQFFFGQHVHQATIHKTLAFLLYTAGNGDLLPLTFIVNISQRCGILTLSYWSSHFQMHPERGPRWGIKYRRCSQKLIGVTAVICEKPLQHYSTACKKEYFQCVDSMCILSIYACDEVSDCFDGSDEVDCSNDWMWNTTITNNIVIPSILTTNSTGYPFFIYIPIYAICDGINLYNIIHHEYICMIKQPIHIDVPGMQNSRGFGIKNRYLWNNDLVWNLYQIEMQLRTPPQTAKASHPKNNETQAFMIEKYLVPCTWKGETVYLEDRCKISVRKSACDYGSIQTLCQNVECPGMFKCDGYYCLHMSAVCDGHIDCQYGEDERYCRNMTCPGLLKCRGENRCVSEQEICDGNSDCLVSSDDEIMCGRCSYGCQCNGYTAFCNVDKFILESGGLTHIKGLVLKTKKTQLNMENLDLTALVYINVSHTTIEKLYFNSKLSSQKIIFADFNSNNIQSTIFLYISWFDKVVYLNFRHNLITNFVAKKFQLSFLTLLDLGQNPLVVVDLSSNLITKRLKILQMELDQFYKDIIFRFPSRYLNTLELHVTDLIYCCLLIENTNCIIDNAHSDCPELIHKTFKLCFYCLVAVATISSFSTLVVHFTVSNRSNTRLARNYMMTITNRLFADVICSIYLLCLAVADIMHVDMILFRKGSFCIMINALSFVAFEVSLIFKTYYVICVALRTIFPFNHQCRWLHLTVMRSFVPWIILTTLYTIVISYILYNNGVFLDQLCSFAYCHTYTRYNNNIFLAIASVIDFMCLVLVLVFLICFFFTLKRRSTSLNRANLKKEKTPFEMVLKLCSPLCTDIIIRLYIAYVYFDKVKAILSIEYNCLIIFIILMPVNIINTCSFSLYYYKK